MRTHCFNKMLSEIPLIVTLIVSGASMAPAQSLLYGNGKIAFTSQRDGNPEIYLVNPDSTNVVRLTYNAGVDDCPAWSPDGTKIAFVSERTSGGFAICTMNADGSNRTEVTPLADFQPERLSWSPDGKKIAFHDFSEVSGSIDIFVVNVDGSGRQNLTPDHTSLDLTPVWSPDGSKILFSRYDSSYPPVGYGGTMLHTINADGTNLTPLKNGFADGWNEDFADWSPVTNKIVYSVNRWDFVMDLYIANPDGTGRQFFHGCDWSDNSCRANAITPTFSPDGAKIAFGVSDVYSINTSQVYIKNLDGTGLSLVTEGSSPSWQPLAPAGCPDPIDCPDIFVRQHYRDFLGREPDAPGLAHWTNEITMCSDVANQLPGETEAQCIDRKRVNTSGAFYLSNEFQNSANFLIRVNWGSLGQDRAIGRKCIAGQHSALDAVCRPLYSDYTSDLAKLTQGIVVNDTLDPNAINLNKHNFVNEFVTRPDFLAAYPDTMTAADYVDKLSQTTGVALTDQERADLIAKVGSDGRAAVLYDIVDGTITIDGGALVFNTRYGKDYYDQEFNPAFVFVEYLGYLRRNPDQAGYDHWLGKLNLYGNFVDAEMVRAFIVSDEYRRRFGPN